MKIGSSQKAYINYLKMKKNYKLKKSSSGYFLFILLQIKNI